MCVAVIWSTATSAAPSASVALNMTVYVPSIGVNASDVPVPVETTCPLLDTTAQVSPAVTTSFPGSVNVPLMLSGVPEGTVVPGLTVADTVGAMFATTTVVV